MFNACLTELKTIVQTERQLRIERQYRPKMKVGKHKGQYLDKMTLSYVKFMYSKHTDDHRTLKAEIERRADKIKPMRFWHDNAEKLPFEKREDGSRTRPITYVYDEKFDYQHGASWYKKALFKVAPYELFRHPVLRPTEHFFKNRYQQTQSADGGYEWWELTATEPATVKMMDGTVTLVSHVGGQWRILYSKALRDTKYNTLFYELDNEEPVAFMPANSVVIHTNKNKKELGFLYAGREYFAMKF